MENTTFDWPFRYLRPGSSNSRNLIGGDTVHRSFDWMSDGKETSQHHVRFSTSTSSTIRLQLPDLAAFEYEEGSTPLRSGVSCPVSPKGRPGSISPRLTPRKELVAFTRLGKGSVDLGRFTILHVLSETKSSTVELVHDTKTGKQHALKRIPLRSMRSRKELMEHLSLLTDRIIAHHPHILRHDMLWQEQGQACLLTAYCSGGTADTLLRKRGTCDIDAVLCQVLYQVSSALSVLHAHNIVHCDVKPSNILVQEDDHLCLADFGVAVETGTLVSDANLDIRYAPLELVSSSFEGQRRAHPANDMFALGLTVYALALGRQLPVAGKGWEQLRHGVDWSAVQGNVSANVKRVVESLLHVNIQHRFTASRVVQEMQQEPVARRTRRQSRVSRVLFQ